MYNILERKSRGAVVTGTLVSFSLVTLDKIHAQHNLTSPDRFNCALNIYCIIDCSESLIETPQKSLPACYFMVNISAPQHFKVSHWCHNQFINCFFSKTYTGCISDKEITIQAGYLDKVPQYSAIMCDKAFGMNEMCLKNKN